MSHPEHSKHCHCVCTDLFDLQAAIEQARAIHMKATAKSECLICGTIEGKCENCKHINNCIVCDEEWPCDTFIALDYMA